MSQTEPVPPRERSASHVSTKQIAKAVLDGRRVTIHNAVTNPLSGYVCGMDEHHLMLVDPSSLEILLVHKISGAPVLSISPTATYHLEPQREALDSIVVPFRSFIEREHFGRPVSAHSNEVN